MFRIHEGKSFVDDAGRVSLVTQVQREDGEWGDYARASVGEVESQIVKKGSSARGRSNPANRIATIIEYIATKAVKKADTFSRWGRVDEGYSTQLGAIDQKAMKIKYPSPVTAAQRKAIIAALRERGFTVRINTQTSARGRESFYSLTVFAPSPAGGSPARGRRAAVVDSSGYQWGPASPSRFRGPSDSERYLVTLHYGKGISPTRWSEYGLSGNINAVESVDDAIRNRDAKRGTVELVLPGGEIKEVYSRSAKKGSSARGRRAATSSRTKLMKELWSSKHPDYRSDKGWGRIGIMIGPAAHDHMGWEGSTAVVYLDSLSDSDLRKLHSYMVKPKGSSARGRRAAPTTAERRKMGQKLQALPWSQASSLYKKAHPQYKGIGGYPMNTKLRASGARSYGVAAYNDGKLTKKDVEIIFRRTHKRYPEMGPLEGLACSGSGKRRKCRSVT